MKTIRAYQLETTQEHQRSLRIAQATIARQNLNFSQLTVYTEAATGPYAGTACIAALAGGNVMALAKNSVWASAEEAVHATLSMARTWGVDNRIQILTEKRECDLAQADIITNTGHVRPLNRRDIKTLKNTAVIPLMWESFEWRPEELDLHACREHGILVMGTDEDKLGFFPYAAESIIRQLHECGVCVYRSSILCLGSGIIIQTTAQGLCKAGAEVLLYTPKEKEYYTTFDQPSSSLKSFLERCDAIVCDERLSHALLLGEKGLIDPVYLASINSSCIIINRHGEIESKRVEQSGLYCFPSTNTASWQSPHLTTAILGLRPVLELMTAGLRVGEVMARARLAGMDPPTAAQVALKNSCAQDFPSPLNLLPIPEIKHS